jgi:CRP/FNR family transcriptional regulator, cyclic AMP receptor protein
MGKGGAGEFFGEGCLAGQPVRMATATAASEPHPPRGQGADGRLLHDKRALSDRFIAHMLARNIRIEEDLIDQRFNSSEKRLGLIDYRNGLKVNNSLLTVVLHD